MLATRKLETILSASVLKYHLGPPTYYEVYGSMVVTLKFVLEVYVVALERAL